MCGGGIYDVVFLSLAVELASAEKWLQYPIDLALYSDVAYAWYKTTTNGHHPRSTDNSSSALVIYPTPHPVSTAGNIKIVLIII